MIQLLLIALVSAVKIEQRVLVLDDANFQTEVAKHDNLMIFFYAPWCGHCRHMHPIYNDVALAMSQLDTPIYMAKVDVTQNPELAKQFNIQSFPKLFWKWEGGYLPYSGGRQFEDIGTFILNQIVPPSVDANCEVIKQRAEGSKYLATFFGNEDSEMFKD